MVSSVPRATVVSEVWTVSSVGTGVEAKTCCPFASRTTNDADACRWRLTALSSRAETLTMAARIDERRVGRHRHDRDELVAGRERTRPPTWRLAAPRPATR